MPFINTKIKQLNDYLNNNFDDEVKEYKNKYENELKNIETEINKEIQEIKENPNINIDDEKNKIKSKIDLLINQLNEKMEKEEENIKSSYNERMKKDSEYLMNEMSNFCKGMSKISDQLNKSKNMIKEMEMYYYFIKEWTEKENVIESKIN